MGSKNRFVMIAVLVALTGVLSTVSLASKVHFVGTPSCGTSGGTLTCTGSLAGLGSQTTVISLSASFNCTNKGGNQPPGQASGQTEPITPQNGRVNFTVSATGSCPDHMAPTYGGAATITAFQNGTQVFSGSVPIK